MKKAFFCFYLLNLFETTIAQVNIDFTANTRIGCGVVQVVFQNKSTGPIKSYSWNLGGIISAAENPSRIFIAPDKYKICLTAVDLNGLSQTVCKNDYIEVKPSFKADFNVSQPLICAGASNQFKDISVSPNGKITTWIWDLGGNVGTVQPLNSDPVTSTYKEPGDYPVTLYVKDEAGCESATTKKNVFKVIPKPDIKLNINSGIVCNLPGEIKITNLSPNSPEITYIWNVSNGNKFTGFDPPPFQFSNEGRYDLNVIAMNTVNNCSDTTIIPEAIVAEQMSKFSLNRRTACLYDTIYFFSSSNIQPDSHFWDFGDGTTSVLPNPRHKYQLAGCYVVIHNTILKGCMSSQVLDTCIRIHDLPQVSYTLDKDRGCQLPLKIQATNTSGVANQWVWTSNGVVFSNDKNPLLEFIKSGIYPIRLEAINTAGCSAVAEQETVEVYQIQPKISSGEVKGCGPLFYTLEHNSYSPDPITQVRWTVFTPVPKVIQGSIATLVIPDIGRFDVRLVVENALGCIDSIEEKEWIRVGRAPVTAMEFSQKYCFGVPVQVIDKSDATADEFLWEFGDGSELVYSKNPIKNFLDPNTYIITHQAFSNGCAGNSIKDSIQILGVKADFEIQIDCNKPNEKGFLNKSVGADSAHWDFGLSGTDLDVDHQFNSRYVYPTSGRYPVLLEVFHKASSCIDTAVLPAIVTALRAGFTLSSYESCVPADIQIISTSQDVQTYQYNFVGAELINPTSATPMVRYSQGGNYTGSLVGTDLLGCRDTFKLIDSIRIHELHAQIETSHQKFCQDSTLILTAINKTINDRIKDYTWKYNNKSFANVPVLEVTIDSIQTHQIVLMVHSEYGCFVESRLNISSNQISADFISDTLLCNEDFIRFTPTISGKWNKLHWDFGDGDTTNQLQPSHQYKTDGQYSVRLMVRDEISGCSQTVVKDNWIRIHDPHAAFEVLKSQEFCPPFIGRVSNKSLYASGYEWYLGQGSNVSTEFEPSRLYTDNGTYDVRLIAKSSLLCTDTFTISSGFVVHGPVIDFIKEVFPRDCTPLPVNYLVANDGVAQIGIEYGDGTQDLVATPGRETPFKHTYTGGGLFYSVIFATDSFGCTSFKLLDTIVLHEVTPRLAFDRTLLCGSEGYVSIQNESTTSDPITAMQFSIATQDFQSSLDAVPDSILLDRYGYYSFKLMLGTEFCRDSILYLDTIQLSPKPAANFEIDHSLLCEGDSVTFTNRSTAINVFISSLKWKVGGKEFNGQSFGWILSPGDLNVRLIAATESGCVDTLERELAVNPSVQAQLSGDTLLCAGSLITLQAEIDNPVAGSEYVWRAGGDFLCDECLQITLRPTASEVYTFEIKHPNGCLSTFNTQVVTFRNNIGTLSLTEDTVICRSTIIPLSAEAMEELYSYQWDPSRRGLSCYTNCRNPLASPDTTTTFIVTVNNLRGCERIDSVTIYVNTPVGIELGPDRTLCRGDSLKISVPGFTDYRWSGSAGLSCSNCSDPVMRPLQQATYFLNALEDGCPVKDSLQIHILSGELLSGRKDTTVCIGAAVQLKTIEGIEVQWLPSPWLDNPFQINPIVKPLKNATFYVQSTQDLCTILDSFVVEILDNTVILGKDRFVCPNTEFSLSVDGDATEYLWEGPNILSGQNTPTIRSITKKDAIYTVIAKNQSCAADTVNLKVNVITFLNLLERIQVNVIKSLPFQLNKNLKLDSSFQFSWSPADDLSCSDCSQPILFTDTSRIYHFQIFDPATGCELSQTIDVQINSSCQAKDYFSIPNVFTPNQDGQNDQLFILPKAADQIKSFRIFDRTGDLVFETYDLQIGWDGRLKNVEVAAGVYVFIVEAECPQLNQRIIMSGDITLIR